MFWHILSGHSVYRCKEPFTHRTVAWWNPRATVLWMLDQCALFKRLSTIRELNLVENRTQQALTQACSVGQRSIQEYAVQEYAVQEYAVQKQCKSGTTAVGTRLHSEAYLVAD